MYHQAYEGMLGKASTQLAGRLEQSHLYQPHHQGCAQSVPGTLLVPSTGCVGQG